MIDLKRSLKNFGALAIHKGSANSMPDVNEMYNIMVSFWGCVKKVFPEAWGLPSTESRLMHSAGIAALGILMDRMVQRYPKDKNLQSNIFLKKILF